MASSRRTGTNENVSTFGDVTRDYTSIATWESDTDYDLVSATTSEVLECYDDASSFDVNNVQFQGATTNSNYFRIIRPAGVRGLASWQGHDGTPNNGFNINTTYNGYVFRINEAFLQVQDIVFNHSFTTGETRTIYVRNPSDEVSIVGCIFKATQTGTNVVNKACIECTNSNPVYIINCLFYKSHAVNGGMNGIFKRAYSGVVYVYNCTAGGNDRGYYLGGGATPIAKNCISENNDVNWSGAWTKTTCTDDDGVIFIDASSNDYHIALNDIVARNQGADLSADANYAFDDDVDGETRSGTWDIGFDEALIATYIYEGEVSIVLTPESLSTKAEDFFVIGEAPLILLPESLVDFTHSFVHVGEVLIQLFDISDYELSVPPSFIYEGDALFSLFPESLEILVTNFIYVGEVPLTFFPDSIEGKSYEYIGEAPIVLSVLGSYLLGVGFVHIGEVPLVLNVESLYERALDILGDVQLVLLPEHEVVTNLVETIPLTERPNKFFYDFQKLLTLHGKLVLLYPAYERRNDPHDKGDKETVYLKPFAIKALIRDESPSKLVWELGGLKEAGAKQIAVDKRNIKNIQRVRKIKINDEEYTVFKDAESGRHQIFEREDYGIVILSKVGKQHNV